MPYYLIKLREGLIEAASNFDGYSVSLHWNTAYASTPSNSIGYNIYMSEVPSAPPNLTSALTPAFPEDFFAQVPAYLVLDGYTRTTVQNLTPGLMYRFGVRAFEFSPSIFDPHQLPIIYDSLRIYPQSLLAANISATDTIIPLIDAETFPPSGTVRIDNELIYYDVIDSNNDLLVPGGTNPTNAMLVNQGGQYYLPDTTNVGAGTINSLSLTNLSAPTETVIIKCIFVQNNALGQVIPGTAVFSAIGSVSGAAGDGYGDAQQWQVDGYVLPSTLLSFSITEETTFALGDSFTVKIAGAAPGIGSGRGYNGSIAAPHYVDGYNGPTNVFLWPIDTLETNTNISDVWNRFDDGYQAYTLVDGYKQATLDILTTDLSVSDAENIGFPPYYYSPYHPIGPAILVAGGCLNTYIGGTYGCADGYSGVGNVIRGLSMQVQNLQRQEMELQATGEQVCLVKRQWTGQRCSCYKAENEYPQFRCEYCFGTGFVVGWTQYFDPRYSSGKIWVRFSQTVDDLIPTDSGLESEHKPNCWGLTVPTIKDRDFLVRFDVAGNEEFRYECLNVTRNRLFLAMEGQQTFVVQRIRKTDPVYQVPITYDTSIYPQTIMSGITAAIPAYPAHSHTIQINENISSAGQIQQVSGVSYGHNHSVDLGSGILMAGETGHTHTISVPITPYSLYGNNL